MNYEIERLKGEAKFSFTFDNEEWTKEVEAAYNRTKHKYAIPGFRKGKIPRKVIENNYGAAVFFDEAFNTAASKAYSQALTENTDIIPVDDPKVDVTDFGIENKGIKFTMNVTTRPEVTLGEYKGLKLNKVEYPTAEADVDKEIDSAREHLARQIEITDRAVINGDTVKIDYSGSVNGVKFDGGTAEGQSLVIGSNTFIPGFEPQVIGMKIGETKDLNVKFPDEYHSEELKGKDAVFTVTVHGITAKELPALDDSLAKDSSKFETLKEYREDIKNRLTEQNNNRADVENKNKLIETITDNAKVEIPACMIDQEVEYILQDFEYRLMTMYQGMKIDDYFRYTNTSKEDFKKERRDEAAKAVKTRLVLQEVIKTEKIEVTDDELNEQIKKIAQNAKKDYEVYRDSLDEHRISHIKNDVLIKKTLDILVAANTFEKAAGAKKTTTKKSEAKTAEKSE